MLLTYLQLPSKIFEICVAHFIESTNYTKCKKKIFVVFAQPCCTEKYDLNKLKLASERAERGLCGLVPPPSRCACVSWLFTWTSRPLQLLIYSVGWWGLATDLYSFLKSKPEMCRVSLILHSWASEWVGSCMPAEHILSPVDPHAWRWFIRMKGTSCFLPTDYHEKMHPLT